jgi:two-component system, LytTR family, response regulator
MKNLNCIIIDDELNARNLLRSIIKENHSQIEISGEAGDIHTAYELINKFKPDFILLDIEMPKGSGFELLNLFSKIDFEIIFATSFNEYAVNAIKISALDYILKPVNKEELGKAIEKVITKKIQFQYIELENPDLIKNLKYNLVNNGLDKNFAFHQDNKVEFIKLKDIICILADDNYCQFYLKNGEKKIHYKNLKEFEDMLSDLDVFMRINRNTIININEIKEYSKGDPTIIKLSNQLEFEISRRRKTEINEKLIKQK